MNLALVEGDPKLKEQEGSEKILKVVNTKTSPTLPDKLQTPEKLAIVEKLPKKRTSRSQSPLSIFWKQYKNLSTLGDGCRRLFNHHVAKCTSLNNSQEIQGVDYSNGYDFLKIYGSYNEVSELLDLEQQRHLEFMNWDAWAVLGILRGDTKAVIESAKEKKILCTSLLSIAPSVSHRFWKEMGVAYAEQLQFLNDEGKNLSMGWRSVCWRSILLLCTADLEKVCSHMCSVGLTADAVAVATIRHADHLRTVCLREWAQENVKSCKFTRAAECYIVLNEIMEAATLLGRTDDEGNLALAAEMAKYATNQPPTNP